MKGSWNFGWLVFVVDFLGDEICDKVTSKALRTVFFLQVESAK